MGYFSDLNITLREEGRPAARAQMARDFMARGYTPAAAHAAADRLMAPKPPQPRQEARS